MQKQVRFSQVMKRLLRLLQLQRVACIKVILAALLLLFASSSMAAQIPIATVCPHSPAGYWLTYDDHDGLPNGIMHLYIRHQLLLGDLVKVINKPGVSKLARCTRCHGADHGRLLDGMTLVLAMQKHGDKYQGGHIFDPRTASSYKGYIKLLTKPCRLLVRGYVGFSLLGKTVYWTPLTARQARMLMRTQVG